MGEKRGVAVGGGLIIAGSLWLLSNTFAWLYNKLLDTIASGSRMDLSGYSIYIKDYFGFAGIAFGVVLVGHSLIGRKSKYNREILFQHATEVISEINDFCRQSRPRFFSFDRIDENVARQAINLADSFLEELEEAGFSTLKDTNMERWRHLAALEYYLEKVRSTLKSQYTSYRDAQRWIESARAKAVKTAMDRSF